MNEKSWLRVLNSCSDNLKSKSGPAVGNLEWLGLSVITFVLVVAGFAADAQQPTNIPLIVRLTGSSASAEASRMEALRQGLRELNYVEEKNIAIKFQSADGKLNLLPTLAADLVRLKVDIIVTGGGSATRAAKTATTTIPIVMTNDPDPVANGFVASLAHPGGNITGLSTYAPELGGKRLEILQETVSKLSRVAVLGTSTVPGYAPEMRELKLAANALKLELQYLDVQNPKDIETAFRAAAKGRAQAVLTIGGGFLTSHRAQIAAFAAKNRLPVMYHDVRYVEDGGLMFYGVNLLDLDRRAATYVDKILKGRKPADLPVEQPMKFEFVINLKAAKQIGLTIPPEVLFRATKVIK